MSNSNETKKIDRERQSPSLIEPQSRGGDTAEGGFAFQDGILLAKIPQWLAHEGFSAFVKEAIGDIESRWFEPNSGNVIDAIEAKNHHVTPRLFWEEVDRFRVMAKSSEYRNFTIASKTVSAEIKGIKESLRRIRDPKEFYDETSDITLNSFEGFVRIIERMGKDRSYAQFLLDRVYICDGWSNSTGVNSGVFQQSVEDWLPCCKDVSSQKLQRVRDRLISLIRGRNNQPITRKDLEAEICCAIDEPDFVISPLIHMQTTTETFKGVPTALQFRWDRFFGGTKRDYPPIQGWQDQLVGQTRATHQWITEHRSTRRIFLDGERRLSTSVALGWEFSAVAGFHIDMEYRSEVWSTDSYPQPTDAYNISEEVNLKTGRKLVIVLDIIRNIYDDVMVALPTLGLKDSPIIHFHGDLAITSDKQVNWISSHIKLDIERHLQQTGAESIHLFLACPSPMALFIGHRINATAKVQCYEWSGGKRYVPTCQLMP